MVQLCVVMVLPCLVPLLSLVLESPEEGGVLVLCVTNLEEALAMHHHLLIALASEYEMVKLKVEGSDIHLDKNRNTCTVWKRRNGTMSRRSCPRGRHRLMISVFVRPMHGINTHQEHYFVLAISQFEQWVAHDQLE
uniref:Secreted protein n=1 Tax=Pavo cristatus TaxID=9049 RepID=A0A8C9FHQ3_PAVCR